MPIILVDCLLIYTEFAEATIGKSPQNRVAIKEFGIKLGLNAYFGST